MSDTYISDSIKYIGADDTTLDLFENQYIVPNGFHTIHTLLWMKKLLLWTLLTREKPTNGFIILIRH